MDPSEVTDEIRAAVYARDCADYGHIPDVDQLFSDDPLVNPGQHTPTVRAQEHGKLPHVRCRRCPTVWLVAQEGQGYDDAMEKLLARLADPAALTAALAEERETAVARAAELGLWLHGMPPPETPAAGHGHGHGHEAPGDLTEASG